MDDGTSHKRRRLDMTTQEEADESTNAKSTARAVVETEDSLSQPARLISLDRLISPPKSNGNRKSFEGASLLEMTPAPGNSKSPASITIPSPVQLTRIRDLDVSKNVDTIGLHDILGDPLIKECWQFNYLFDVDFLM